MGSSWPVAGWRAVRPLNTPSLGRDSSTRSSSDIFRDCSIYSATSGWSITFLTSSCSGAITIKVHPHNVSGRLVNISRISLRSPIVTGKRILAPSERPIQLIWAALTFSMNSVCSRPEMSRSAYCVIRTTHWLIWRRVTSVPQRSQCPLITSSFARPTLQEGHQLIGISAL